MPTKYQTTPGQDRQITALATRGLNARAIGRELGIAPRLVRDRLRVARQVTGNPFLGRSQSRQAKAADVAKAGLGYGSLSDAVSRELLDYLIHLCLTEGHKSIAEAIADIATDQMLADREAK